MKVYEALETLKKEGPEYETCGICGNIFQISSYDGDYEWERFHKQAFKAWSKFSGCVSFPVEGSVSEFSRTYGSNRWDKETKYGALRWELLDHLIDWFKKKDI